MKNTFLFILFILLVSISCGQNNKKTDGIIENGVYQNNEIGWSISIPNGWEIIPDDQLQAKSKTGKDAIDKVSNEKIDLQALRYLISFKKDHYNLLASTLEPFNAERYGDYSKYIKENNALAAKAFADQGLKADTTSGVEIVQGIEFKTFYCTFYGKDDKVFLKQVLYCTLRNGFDFGVMINYNNEEDKNTLLTTFKNSTFKN